MSELKDESLELIPETEALVEPPPDAPSASEPDDRDELIAQLEAELKQARVEIDRRTLSADALARIARAEEHVTIAEKAHDASKKETNLLKKEWEASVQNLQRVIRKENESLPLFDRKPKTEPAPQAQPENNENDESWREVLINSLTFDDGSKLPQGILDSLAEAEILTVGELQSWQEPRPKGKGKRLVDIPGIGPGKAQKIEDILICFWKTRQLEVISEAKAEINETLVEGVRQVEAEQLEALWRAESTDDLEGLSDSDWEILSACGISTLGNLYDAVQSDEFDATYPDFAGRRDELADIVSVAIDQILVKATDAPTEVSASQQWRTIPVASLGLLDAFVEALGKGGIRTAQDLVFASRETSYVDSIPGVDPEACLEAIREAVKRFRQSLPDDQAFDLEAFEAEHFPSVEPVKPSKNGKRSKKTTA